MINGTVCRRSALSEPRIDLVCQPDMSGQIRPPHTLLENLIDR